MNHLAGTAIVFTREFWPALLLLAVGMVVGALLRWNRQRPLSSYPVNVLQDAFALNPGAFAYYRRRGSLSLRELSRALRLTRRLLQQELRSRH